MRVNKTFSSITAGSAVNAVTGTTAAPGAGAPIYVRRIFIQALHSATTGIVFVLDAGGPARVPATSNGDDVVAEIPPATAAAPGGSYEDRDDRESGGIDLRTVWIDVATTNTPVKLSYDLKV